jgi:hypothetical protein
MFEFRASKNVRFACGILALGGLVSVNQAAASVGSEAAGDRRALESASDARGLVARLDDLGEVDPIRFFKRLVDRYRAIEDYVEETEVEQITDDPATDDPPIRTRTRVRAEVRDARLMVERPGLLDDVGRSLTSSKPGATPQDLWLLPHLRLRFSDSPLEEFRPGEAGGFRAAEADRVVVDDREMVRVELRAGGEAESGPTDARFSLFVDPERMLVERVEGEEWLPGGLRQQTTLRIESIRMLKDDWMDSEDSGSEATQPVSGSSPGKPAESKPTTDEGDARSLDDSSAEAGRSHAGLSFFSPAG